MSRSSNPVVRDRAYLRRLLQVGVVEAVSTLLLFFVAMPLKYGAGIAVAVRVVGAIHGVLFVIYVAMLALAIRRVPIPTGTALLGAAAAVVPFGPFLFHRRLAAQNWK